jgi:hypothetical protein
MSTVVIAAEVVDLVRDGLRSQISLTGQHLASADETPCERECPERYQEPLECLDALRTLLDEIGWSGSPSNLKIDLGTHAWALIQALQDQLSDYADKLRDLHPDDERREAIARKADQLTNLALIVLLRTQTQLLRPTPAQCS